MSLTSQNLANIVSLGTIEKSFSTPVSVLNSQIILFGNYDQTKTSIVENKIYDILSATHAGELFGEGFQLSRMAQYIYESSFTGTVKAIALTEAVGGVASVKTLSFTGTATASGTLTVRAGSYLSDESLLVSVALGDTSTEIAEAVATAVNAVTTLPFTAVATTGDVVFTSKTADITSTDLNITISAKDDDADLPEGVTYTLADTTDGVGYADIDSALNVIAAEDGGWNTALITPYNDVVILDKVLAVGGNPNNRDGMYNTIDYRPFNSFVVDTSPGQTALTDLATITGARTTDCVNIYFGAPDSPELGYEIACGVCGQISEQAQTDDESSRAYIMLDCDFLFGPLDNTNDWTTYTGDVDVKSYENRDYAVQNGITPLMYKDSTMNIQDVVTPWSNDTTNAPFTFAVNIRKAWNMQSSYLLYLDGSDIKGLAIVDNASAVDVDALDKNDIDDGLSAVTHGIYLKGWIYSEDFTVNNTTVENSTSNPDRFVYEIPAILSGNYRQGDGDIQLTRDQSVVTLILEV